MRHIKLLSVMVMLLVLTSFSFSEAVFVYVMDSGDSTNNNLIKDALIDEGHMVTIGQPWYMQDASQSLASYDAVVLLPNHVWTGSMPLAGQTKIIDYVANGGGLVTAEWFVWCLGAGGHFDNLSLISPVVNTTAYHSGLSITYTQSTPDPVLNDGVSPSFTFTADNYSGTESLLNPKLGTKVYYSSSGIGGGELGGLVGWDYVAGRVISFSTVIGSGEMQDTNYKNLFINSVEWAANEPAAPVPIPSTCVLLLFGLAGMAGIKRKFNE